jgi:hypothetical protein
MRLLHRTRSAKVCYIIVLAAIAASSGLHGAFYALFTLNDIRVGPRP